PGAAVEVLGTRNQVAVVAYQFCPTKAIQQGGTRVRVTCAPQGQAGRAAEIRVRDQVVNLPAGADLQVAVMDRNTGRVTTQRQYDTSASPAASDDLAELIE